MSFSRTVRFAAAALAFIVVTAGMPLEAAKAQGESLKIGVVSIPRLLKDSPQAKAAMEALEQEFAPRQRTIVAKQKEFQDKNEQVQRDLAVMGDAERRNAERELREAQRELTRLQSEFVEDRNLRLNEELGKLQRSLLQEVQSFARGSGYDIIIGDGVLYANDSINVTDQILRVLEDSYEASGGR